MAPIQRSTPAGQHRPVLLEEVLAVLEPGVGDVVVDCTLGWAGHAVELLRRVGPAGRLVGIDCDAEQLPSARRRLEEVGFPFSLHHANFAGLPAILGEEGISAADLILADLGMSSVQVDEPGRGFSYARDGELDMRLDRSRGRTAAELLADIPEEDLCRALRELGDEPEAERLASAIVAGRGRAQIRRTADLAQIIVEAAGTGRWQLHPRPGKWNLHPAARTFQTLRMLVNRELGNLFSLMRVLPLCLSPGGRAAVISFHSGEDRIAKTSIRNYYQSGLYDAWSRDPIRPSLAERTVNPRARSAKLRWARRAPFAG
jgi:16S rRNA (cytosine1402-N4)-methyltransferase